MSNACKGLAGLIFGHKYQPRYSKGAPTAANIKLTEYDAEIMELSIRAVEASKPTTYVHDVCARCGAVTAERRT